MSTDAVAATHEPSTQKSLPEATAGGLTSLLPDESVVSPPPGENAFAGERNRAILGRSDTAIHRKLLPWLSKARSSPNVAADHAGADKLDQARNTGLAGASSSQATAAQAPVTAQRSTDSIGRDVATEAATATPLQSKDKAKDQKIHRHFLRRRQSTHTSRPAQVKPQKGAKAGQSEAAYITSEYSGSLSSDEDPTPARPRRKHAASHESLANLTPAPVEERHNPFQGMAKWMGTEPDAQQDDSPVSPRTSIIKASARTKTLKPDPSPYRKPPVAHVRGQRDNRPRHEPWLSSTEESSLSSVQPPPRPLKQPTLRELPDHLMGPSSSSSQYRKPTMLDYKTVPPLAKTTNNRPSLGSLNRAVTGLENLMEEALHVAQDAARSGRPEEIAAVLNSATLALRKASSAQSQMGGPLVLSSSDSQRSVYTDTRSNVSTPMRSRDHSIETAPTVYTKSAKSSMQPVLNEPYTQNGCRPVETKGVIGRVGGDDDATSHHESISHTPPRLYAPASANSMVRDFAYTERKAPRRSTTFPPNQGTFGLATDYYGDQGQSVRAQPGVRASLPSTSQLPPLLPPPPPRDYFGRHHRFHRAHGHHLHHVHPMPLDPEDNKRDADPEQPDRPLRRVKKAQQNVRVISPQTSEGAPPPMHEPHHRHQHHTNHWQLPEFFESAYYRLNEEGVGTSRSIDTDTDPTHDEHEPATAPAQTEGDGDESAKPGDLPQKTPSQNLSLKHPRRNHISLKDTEGFSLGRYHRRQPIAREWNPTRKVITAMIACLNTLFVGFLAGIYAGEVPRIQYQLADTTHWVINGNVCLFAGLGLTTLLLWPLPLLHGRKPYILLAFALMLPLQFPQAIVVSNWRPPKTMYKVGLLLPRALTGCALGLANVNFLPTLFDLYGASLMSERPHQEIVTYDDVRRQGGGMGMWLGIWTFCFSSSLSFGFCVGACIISKLDPAWGFYIVVILLAVFLLINVVAPETRRSPYRRSIAHFFDDNDPERLKRRVARGEVKLHISNDGPKWWFQEVWAGVILTKRMMAQPGFFILMSYLGWIKAELVMVILLLGALLSRDYQWQSQYVGLASLAIPVGALLAMPLTKASWLSRSRDRPPRTDSMTFQKRVTWTSHLLRRTIFTILLPFAGLGYCLSAEGSRIHWTAPIIFAGFVGFLTDLGIAECVGLIMETFDTCDLQPGTNTRHRLQSMSSSVKRRRTNYSSFPRVCAGFFAAQAFAFFLAAAATGVSGHVTNAYGAQTSIAIVAGILLFVTVWLCVTLWRFKEVQVIPNFTDGAQRDSKVWGPSVEDPEWKPVVIGNPSGKVRRVNLLESGQWSRWSEIRRMNKLAKEK